MKTVKILIAALVLCAVLPVSAAPKLKYVDGKMLNLIGQLMPTSQPYARIDTLKYDGFTPRQRVLNQQPSGLALAFRTGSSQIVVKSYSRQKSNNPNTTGIALYGYDLYVKKNGEWLFAGAKASDVDGKPLKMVENMASGDKECLLYLPEFCHLDSVKVGVDADAVIEPMDNPFRHRIVVFGSSFTHGTSANRSGMSYPMILEKSTGLYIMNLGMSGNSKLQQSYARVLADADVDAMIFDAFSNPSADEIEKNFASFVATIRAKHPSTPLIFLQTLYRENSNFDTKIDRNEQAKMDMAERVVSKAMKTDANIYFVNPKDSTGTDHLATTDGTHPSALGYYRLAKALEPELLGILKKYGIQ